MNWFYKSEEDTSFEYGKFPEQRSLEELVASGFFLLDKHEGPTSYQATEWAKEIVKAKKAGHAGTLELGKSLSDRSFTYNFREGY